MLHSSICQDNQKAYMPPSHTRIYPPLSSLLYNESYYETRQSKRTTAFLNTYFLIWMFHRQLHSKKILSGCTFPQVELTFQQSNHLGRYILTTAVNVKILFFFSCSNQASCFQNMNPLWNHGKEEKWYLNYAFRFWSNTISMFSIDKVQLVITHWIKSPNQPGNSPCLPHTKYVLHLEEFSYKCIRHSLYISMLINCFLCNPFRIQPNLDDQI